uniref:Uncharacterized protein n=1 Tax=Providencia stuartii TaxID=588 RepID=A0AAI9GK39_PROST|nr:hypothetical protein [Providencia stuartii]
MLFVGVCGTEYDLEKNWDGLTKSIQALKQSFHGDIFVYGIFQIRKNSTFDLNRVNINTIFNDFDITSEFGVSCSRNKIINKALSRIASHKPINYILFHDISIRWNTSAANFLYYNRKLFPCVTFKYSTCSERKYYAAINNDYSTKYKKVNILLNTYVGSYLFSLDTISGIIFNEEFGPGDKTKYKSGEDVLFLSDYIKKNKISKIITSESVYLYHPQRPTDFSKHLLYARGQGKLYRILLTKKFNHYYLYRFFLFITNALLRCILFKKNAFLILKERIIGFLRG